MVRRPTGHSRPHDVDPKKIREADAKRMARIGWLVTGGLALVSGVVLIFVMNTHARASAEPPWEEKQRKFVEDVRRKYFPNEASIKSIEDLNEALAGLIKTRSLKERLDAIEAHLAGAPNIEVLAKDFADVRDLELETQASEVGGELEVRFKATAKEVTKCYLAALRKAANTGTSAITGK